MLLVAPPSASEAGCAQIARDNLLCACANERLVLGLVTHA